MWCVPPPPPPLPRYQCKNLDHTVRWGLEFSVLYHVYAVRYIMGLSKISSTSYAVTVILIRHLQGLLGTVLREKTYVDSYREMHG